MTSVNRNLAHACAGIFALSLVGYAVSDGNAGHPLVQVGLLLAGGVAVYETLIELVDDVWDRLNDH